MWARPEWESPGPLLRAVHSWEPRESSPQAGERGLQKGTPEDAKTTINPNNFLSTASLSGKV